MPELPEVETVVRQLHKRVAGRKIEKGKVLRTKTVRGTSPAQFVRKIKGSTIQSVTRRAKYIVFQLDNGQVWISHLGMTGKFVVNGSGHHRDWYHVRAWFKLSGGQELIFTDMRIFGFMTAIPEKAKESYFNHIGVEPLTKALNTGYLKQALAHRSIPIKDALLHQQIIAGIGNIYASEALFDAKVSPRKAANRLTRAQLTKIISSIKKILKKAIKYNGTTIINFSGVDEKTGRFRSMLKVYGEEGEACPGCGKPIKRIVQAQRSTFYCPKCQK